MLGIARDKHDLQMRMMLASHFGRLPTIQAGKTGVVDQQIKLRVRGQDQQRSLAVPGLNARISKLLEEVSNDQAHG